MTVNGLTALVNLVIFVFLHWVLGIYPDPFRTFISTRIDSDYGSADSSKLYLSTVRVWTQSRPFSSENSYTLYQNNMKFLSWDTNKAWSRQFVTCEIAIPDVKRPSTSLINSFQDFEQM